MATKKATSKRTSTPKGEKADATPTAAETADVDRVASVSRRADGTPDQRDGFEVIGEDADNDKG